MVYVLPTELYHHGILGQKWGVRRYQNEDGTLTNAGRKRYAKDLYKTIKKNNGPSGMYTKERIQDLEAMKRIRSDKALQAAKEKHVKTLNDSFATMDYDAYKDKEAMDMATKMFKNDFGRNPDMKKDSKIFDYYLDSAEEDSKMWKEAYNKERAAMDNEDAYIAQVKKSVQNVLGSYGNQKVRDVVHGTKTLQEVVENYFHQEALDEWAKKYAK